MELEHDRRHGWTLDRTISIPFIAMILIQTLGIAIWGATLDSRVTSLEQKLLDSNSQAERLIRLDERVTALQSSMGKIEILLQQQQTRALLRSNANVNH